MYMIYMLIYDISTYNIIMNAMNKWSLSLEALAARLLSASRRPSLLSATAWQLGGAAEGRLRSWQMPRGEISRAL